MERPDPDFLELHITCAPNNRLGDESIFEIIQNIVDRVKKSGATKICLDFRLNSTGAAIETLSSSVCDLEQVQELHLSIQSYQIDEYFGFDCLGKLRSVKLANVQFYGDVRIHEQSPWILTAKKVTFKQKAEFLSNLVKIDMDSCIFEDQLFVHGQVEKLRLANCSLKDVRLAPNFLGRNDYKSRDEGFNSFSGSTLAGQFLVDEVQSSQLCTLDFRGVKFAPGAKLSVRTCDLSIDIRGVTLPSTCELLFERNAARVFDMRIMNVSSGAKITFRNQPLNQLLTSGTNLAQFSFLMVTFADRHGYAYLADDMHATHLPIEYKSTHGSPNELIPKIWGTDVPERATLESYRQLISYFDNARDFRMAESFHFSEMSLVERLHKKELQERFGRLGTVMSFFSFHAFYRRLAAYGTSYARAGAWLVVMLFVIFPFWFMSSGIQMKVTSKTVEEAPYVIALEPVMCQMPQVCFQKLGQNLENYSTATIYTLLLAGLQKDDRISPVNLMGYLGKALVAPITLGQLALFIIALKRRFRRGAN